MAADDMMAILYLLQRPYVDVKGITVIGTGETHCAPGIEHALGLVALAGLRDIPVACGREMPLRGSHAFPGNWRARVDGLYGQTLPKGRNPAQNVKAVDLLTSLVSLSPQKVILIALGPLTNVAEMLQATPSLVNNIEMIYVMGGALHVPGNVGSSGVGISNKVAEWNIYIDPHAANVVFNSGASVTLVPLDATNYVPFTTTFYERINSDHKSQATSFVFQLLTEIRGSFEWGAYYFWDPLAAAISTDQSLATFQTETPTVVEKEGSESGRIIKSADDRRAVRVAVSADASRFEQTFLQTLNDRLMTTSTSVSTLESPTSTLTAAPFTTTVVGAASNSKLLILVFALAVIITVVAAWRRGLAPTGHLRAPSSRPSATTSEPPQGIACQRCGFVNRPGARFCTRDRTSLAPTVAQPEQLRLSMCASCGTVNGPNASFCKRCSRSLH